MGEMMHPLDRAFSTDFKSVDEALDFLELRMSELPEQMIDCPLDHTFTPGLYCRTIYMPKGSLIVSRVHNTTHQFIISRGSAMVFTEGKGWEMLEAGLHGITVPGARRLLYITEDCVWSTVHPLGYVKGTENLDKEVEKATVEFIENDILQPERVKHKKICHSQQ